MVHAGLQGPQTTTSIDRAPELSLQPDPIWNIRELSALARGAKGHAAFRPELPNSGLQQTPPSLVVKYHGLAPRAASWFPDAAAA
jgi:hypothetical protein